MLSPDDPRIADRSFGAAMNNILWTILVMLSSSMQILIEILSVMHIIKDIDCIPSQDSPWNCNQHTKNIGNLVPLVIPNCALVWLVSCSLFYQSSLPCSLSASEVFSDLLPAAWATVSWPIETQCGWVYSGLRHSPSCCPMLLWNNKAQLRGNSFDNGRQVFGIYCHLGLCVTVEHTSYHW